MTDARTRLVAVLTRLGALDLAGEVWTVRDLGELPAEVRAAIYDVLGTAAAVGWRERELDELAQVLELDDYAQLATSISTSSTSAVTGTWRTSTAWTTWQWTSTSATSSSRSL